MEAVCWDKYCRDPGDQLLRNDIMACVFAGVSPLLKTGGFPKVEMWELPVFLRACSVGAHLEQIWFLGQLSYTMLEQLLLPFQQKKVKNFP